MVKSEVKNNLKLLEVSKDHLRKKIACVGGKAATKLVRELGRIESEISKMKSRCPS